MKVLIVDDEQLARDRLVRMVTALADHDVVGEAGNGLAALRQVQQLDPDLVLLDIRMPGMDGLETARHLTEFEQPPAVIFCTAYEEHALQAFDLQAVGYLLKPVRRDALAATIDKARRLNKAQLATLAGPEPAARSHISARTRRGIELVPVDDVRFFRADQKYVTVRHCQGELVIAETLRDLEVEFGDRFVRIHRSALVSSLHIETLERTAATGTSRVRLRDVAEPLDVSRRHLAALRRLVKNL